MTLLRLDKAREYLKENHFDALYVNSPCGLNYYTGLKLSHGMLIITLKSAYLLVSGIYFEACRNLSDIRVVLGTNLSESGFIRDIVSQTGTCIAFDSEVTSYHQVQELQKAFCQEINKVTLEPIYQLLKTLRTVKEGDEIKKIRKACDVCSLGFDYVCQLLRKGISEKEVAQELEIFWKKQGSEAVSFDPIIAFGANSALPHHRAGDARLMEGQHILVDIGVKVEGYHSDMTRVIWCGTPDPQIDEIYQVVKQAQKAALNLCQSGISTHLVDQAARSVITSAGYEKQFVHRLGHGLGLEIHELPLFSTEEDQSCILQVGMVLTIEPGIYLPGIGGIRLEDTIVIQEGGYEDLTCRSVDPSGILNS